MEIIISNSEDCKKLSIDQLAVQRDGSANNSPKAILIDNEIERKKRIHQHELDLKLITKQVRWMKFSVCAILIAAVMGGIVGYYLTTLENSSRNKQLKSIQELIQKTISDKKDTVYHKETIEQSAATE